MAAGQGRRTAEQDESIPPPAVAPARPVGTANSRSDGTSPSGAAGRKAKAPDAVDYKIVVCPFCNGPNTAVMEGKDVSGPGWRYRICNNGCVEKRDGKMQGRRFKENFKSAAPEAQS